MQCRNITKKATKPKTQNPHKKNVVGVDIPFEEPINSDLIIDTAILTADECFRVLWNAIFHSEDRPRSKG